MCIGDTHIVVIICPPLVAKQRREQNFPGHEKIIDQLKNGVLKKRVGFMYSDGPPCRG